MGRNAGQFQPLIAALTAKHTVLMTNRAALSGSTEIRPRSFKRKETYDELRVRKTAIPIVYTIRFEEKSG